MKRLIKILLWSCSGLIAFIVVAVMGAVLWANSDSGQKKIASLIEDLATNEEMKLSLGSFEGYIPSRMELVDLTLADREGIWLRIDRARLVWSPFELFDAKLLVHDLSADNVEVLRKPVASTATPEPVDKKSSGGGIPSFPFSLSLENLGAKRIHIAESLLGQEVDFSVSSHAEIAELGDNLDLDLLIKRIDQTPGTVKAVLAFKPSTNVLHLDVQAHEPKGGMLVRTLKVPGLPELSMILTGDGPIEDWSAEMNATAGPDLTIAGAISIQQKLDELYELEVDLVSNVTAFLEKELQPLVGKKMKLESLVMLDTKGNIHLQNLNLNIPAASVSANGKVSGDGSVVDLKYKVTVGDPTLFAKLAPGMTWKSIDLDGKAKGLATHPRINTQLKVIGFEGFEISIREANVNVTATPNKPFGDPKMVLAINADGNVIGVRGSDPQIEKFAGEKINWKVLANVFLNEERLEIRKTSLKTKVASLEINDTQIKKWGEEISLKSLIRLPDLSQFEELAGIDLQGGLDLHLNAKVKDFGQHVEADVAGTITGLQTGIEPADALLGDAVQLDVAIKVDPQKNVLVKNFTIKTPFLATKVSANLKSDQSLRADYSIEFPELDVLAEPLEMALAGTLKLSGKVNGKMESPNVTLNITTPHLVVQENTIEDARIDISARDLTLAPAGKVNANVTVNGLEARASTKFVLKDNEDLSLKNIDLLAFGTQITGALQVALKQTTAQGKLNGHVVDMALLGDFIKQDLKGDVKFSLDLSENNHQSAALVVDISNFELAGAAPIKVAELQFNTDVKNALKDPIIKSSLKVKGFSTQLAEGEAVIQDVMLNVDIQNAIEEPAIQVDLEVKNISSLDAKGATTLKVANIKLNADVKNAIEDPVIKSSLQVKTIATTPVEIEAFTLNANGTLKAIKFDLVTLGQLTAIEKSLQVKSSGEVGIDGEEKRLQLDNLAGNLGDVPFKLLKPMLVKVFGKGIVVKDLDLSLDKSGRVKADFQMQEEGVQGSASLANLSLDIARIAGVVLSVNGNINAEMNLAGSFTDPEVVAKLNLDDIAIIGEGDEDSQKGNASVVVNWRQGMVDLVAKLTQSQIGNLNITGKVPLRLKQEPMGVDLRPTTPLNVNVSGKIHLAYLNDFISGEGHQVKGNLDLSGKVSGILAEPKFNIIVALKEGEYENFNTGTLLKNIELLVKADPKQIHIEKLHANTPKEGTISVNGLVKILEDDFDMDIKLVMNKAQLTATDSIIASASSNIELIGPLKNSMLQGKIIIEQVDIYIPENLPPSVVVLEVEEEKSEENLPEEGTARKKSNKEEPAMKIGLNLEIDFPGRVYVRGRGLDAALGGKLEVTGTHLEPNIDGDLTMHRGTLNILNRQFNFSRGIVSLDGVPGHEPTLDFIADAKPADDAKMAVLVTGPVSMPKISLWSDPELPQDEILSRILFGKSAGAITSVEALELAASAATFTGVGAGPGLVDNLRDSLGLDTLKFNNDDEDTGPGVEAGRYVAEGVYVGVKQGVQTGTSAATVQIDVTPNIKIESDIGADSTSRLGIRMEWDY